MVIGIDTSGNVCSVACIDKGAIISERSINDKKTHSATLVPLLKEMLEDKGLSVSEASLFAVAKGPGSFTGLRIGTATAKGLSFALDTPIVGVSTLAALSYNLRDYEGIICPIMDARRNEVYTAAYRYGTGEGSGLTDNGVMETIGSPVISPVAKPLEKLLEDLFGIVEKTGERVTFLGDGVSVYREFIKGKARFEFDFAPEDICLQRASSVALLGKMLASFEAGPSNSLRLEYLRRPQAERERLGL